MKRIAVLTSGGDAPGMNAAIRAVARMGASQGLEVFGDRHGYTGLIAGDFMPLGPRDVGGILERCGTVLGTTRCVEIKTEAGQAKAPALLQAQGTDGLVVVGGNGSQSGARAVHRKGLQVVGVASTIDNDLAGTDVTIGATTAVDVALESVDRRRVTAASHQRVFLGLNFDFRVCRLGHVQRGGAPSVADRLLATPLEQVAQRTNPHDPV